MSLKYTQTIISKIEEAGSKENAITIMSGIIEDKITISGGVLVGKDIWAIEYYSNLLLCIDTVDKSTEIVDVYCKTWNYKEEGFRTMIFNGGVIYLIPGKENYVVEFNIKDRKSIVYQLDKYDDFSSCFVYAGYLYMLSKGDGPSYKLDIQNHQLEKDEVVEKNGILGGTLVGDHFICGKYPDNVLLKYDLICGKVSETEIKEIDTYIVNCLFDGAEVFCLTQNGDILVYDKELRGCKYQIGSGCLVEKTKWGYQNISFYGDNIILIPNRRTPWKKVNRKNHKERLIPGYKEMYPKGNAIFPCRNIVEGFEAKYIPVIDGVCSIYTINEHTDTILERWDPHYRDIDKEYVKEKIKTLMSSLGVMTKDDLKLMINVL